MHHQQQSCLRRRRPSFPSLSSLAHALGGQMWKRGRRRVHADNTDVLPQSSRDSRALLGCQSAANGSSIDTSRRGIGGQSAANGLSIDQGTSMNEELRNLMDQFTALALAVSVPPEIACFISQAVFYRKEKEAKHRNILLREVVERYIINQAPMCLDFLSSQCKAVLVECYFTLPYFLVSPREATLVHQQVTAGGQSEQVTASVPTTLYDYDEYMLPLTSELDAAIFEALDYAAAAFETVGAPALLLDQLCAAVFKKEEESNQLHPGEMLEGNKNKKLQLTST